MASTRVTRLIGAALALGFAQGASAADLGNYGGGGSLKDGPFMIQEAPRASWYIRADGTYSSFDTPSITENGISTLTEANIDNNFGYGGGIGLYFGHGFRGDVTIDRLSDSDVSANLPDPKSTLPGLRQFGLSSTVVLGNLYYDFDWGNRFSPYVGVGLGVTRNKTSAGTVTDPCDCFNGTIDSGSDTHVAGAAMAGFTLKLRDRLSFDAGYRFLYLGSADTGPVTATFGATGGPGGQGAGTQVAEDPRVEDIHAHEFRFGLRYDIN